MALEQEAPIVVDEAVWNAWVKRSKARDVQGAKNMKIFAVVAVSVAIAVAALFS